MTSSTPAPTGTVEVNGTTFPTETVRLCDLQTGDVVVTNGPAAGCWWQTENRVATVRQAGFVGDATNGFLWTSDNPRTPDEFDDLGTFAVVTCPTGSFTRSTWLRLAGPVPC